MPWKRIVVLVAALFVPALQPLGPSAQAAVITLTNFQADMTSSVDPFTGIETISLRVNSAWFGPGGFAAGLAAVGTGPPNDGIWLANPFGGNPPDDGMPAIGFLLNPGGTVMGIQPEPFRIFLVNPPDDSMPGARPTIIGELDFSGVTGSSGSLNLSGVEVWAINPNDGTQTGEVFAVAPFTIQNVPEPATLVLFVSGLALLKRGRD